MSGVRRQSVEESSRSISSSSLYELNFATSFVGREQELDQLEHIYRVTVLGDDDGDDANDEEQYHETVTDSSDSSLALLEGYGGSGKTKLVCQFLHKVKEAEHGDAPRCCILQGKYHRQQEDPYSGIVEALSGLWDEISSHEDKSALKQLRDGANTALGKEGKVLTDFVPSLIQVLGEQQNPSYTETMENERNRLHHLFLTLFKVLCTKKRPVILFLDDITWVDEASLGLLSALLTDRSQKHLMLIGCIRPNECPRESPLSKFLVQLESERPIHRVSIGNLPREEIDLFLSAILRVDDASDLTEVVYQKTHGNIFHVRNILEVLQRKNLLKFGFFDYSWKYDVERIDTEIAISENVAEMLLLRIDVLPDNARTILTYAANIRSKFDVDTLYAVLQAQNMDIFMEDLESMLGIAVKSSLLQQEKDSRIYSFTHDRIQEAFHDLLTNQGENARADFRRNVGKVLVERAGTSDGENWMFFVGANNINENSLSSFERSSKSDLVGQAKLNLEAGEKAIKISAFVQASKYLQTGLCALRNTPEAPWENYYDLTLHLIRKLAIMKLVLGDFEQGNNLSQELLENAASLKDKLPTYSSLANALGRREQHAEAFELCQKVLHSLRAIPSKFLIPITIVRCLIYVKKTLKQSTNQDILKLPIMTDTDVLTSMEFLTEFGLRAFLTDQLPFTLLSILLQIKLTFKFGLCARSSQAFAAFGMILGDAFADYAGATRMAELGRNVLKVTEGKFMESLTLFTTAAFIDAWNAPRNQVLGQLQQALTSGIECGDFENSFRARGVKNIYAYISGYPLQNIESAAAEVCEQCKQFQVEAIFAMVSPFHLLLQHLTGKLSIDWKAISETPQTVAGKKNASETYRQYLYFLYRTQIAYYFGNLELASKLVSKAERYAATDTTYSGTIMRVFFSGLVASGLFQKTGNRKHKRQARKYLRAMKQVMKRGGANTLHKYLLMKAEFAAAISSAKNESQHKAAYDNAISAASRAGFTNDAALANELAGMYFMRVAAGDFYWAKYYLNSAKELYDEWGAHAKSNSILFKFGEMLADVTSASLPFSKQSDAINDWTYGGQSVMMRIASDPLKDGH